ncbi:MULTISPECIES: helix-turn-helix domain-containing protein [Prauserella salsuginis group]|uniref:Helix-turn-helix domain-containing protein n=1 Tax=Prauserella salsuginis TaxID=387889 RepID=A0ABW6FWM2_9PSEU|nr:MULTISPECIES: helix-turn-helix domain-containing protein [Prauserella salsuginis group]MCR3720378.1 transcriptional regulator, AraC family [Prauserella flava]MCR3733913.1 transcriptional regulator, AraC family [Prauserella salsuginis]
MAYTEQRADVPGAGAFGRGWVLWRNVADVDGPQRIMPDGALDLMVHEGRFVVAGADRTAVDVAGTAGAVTWGLRLPPGVAPALLGVPAGELTGLRVDLADVTRVPVHRPDRPWRLPGVAEALWRQAAPDPAELRLAASLDRAARTGAAAREVADDHGLSERSLRRNANRFFGYGIKTLTSVHRFQCALRLARSGTPLGEAAALAGYTDQAHLTREVRRLSGVTPGALTA